MHMRSSILALVLPLLAAGPAMAGDNPPHATPASDLTIVQCTEQPTALGPYGDGTASGELFAIYAEEINAEVLIYPEDLFEAEPTPPREPFHTEQAQVRGEGWFDPYAVEGPDGG